MTICEGDYVEKGLVCADVNQNVFVISITPYLNQKAFITIWTSSLNVSMYMCAHVYIMSLEKISVRHLLVIQSLYKSISSCICILLLYFIVHILHPCLCAVRVKQHVHLKKIKKKKKINVLLYEILDH